MENKNCLECGEKIIGRADKKFCSDYCRNAFNNKQNQSANNLIRNINNTLKRNWRILEELNPEDKCKVHKNKLIEQSFNFSYYTSIYQTKTGNTYYFVYDQGYMELENSFYMLVKKG
jgi:predicted nucleic acid-binding Zn ribbon protein